MADELPAGETVDQLRLRSEEELVRTLDAVEQFERSKLAEDRIAAYRQYLAWVGADSAYSRAVLLREGRIAVTRILEDRFEIVEQIRRRMKAVPV